MIMDIVTTFYYQPVAMTCFVVTGLIIATALYGTLKSYK